MKADFLDSLRSGMRLTWETFRKIYGYAVTDPEFADKALTKLEKEGCSKARAYYAQWVEKYEAEREEMLKSVSDWYMGWLHEERERKREEAMREWRDSLMTLSSQELEKLCTKLLQNGTISDPSEFVTMARLVL